jgi:hypothetical protein
MPRRDRTGPAGQGPMTGRGLGPCGMGFKWKNSENLTKEEEKNILKTELKKIEKRLKELE